MLLSRRSLVTCGMSAFAVSLGARGGAAEGRLAHTLPQTIGPFYPVARPLDQDSDLTIVRGTRGKARGQVINVVGRVVDPDGRPIADARLDLWQANSAGRYAHPADTSAAPLDPDFQGAAVLTADAQGRYRFRTVKPGAYAGRTPHIHFDVAGRAQRVVTQMYFPGEAQNQSDGLLNRVPAGEYRDRLIARSVAPLRDDPNTAAFAWDIVLLAG